MTTSPGSSLGRSTRTMAIGTIASRGTGFVRNAAIVAVLGVHTLGAAYNVANTTPNIVYELLLGGILTSVLVPVLVRAAKDDPDGGEAFAQRLLSLVVIVLTVASILLVVFAPALVDLYGTPTLLMHGENDNDVPIAEAEQFYVALKDVGTEAVMVRYPREGHGLREPKHLVDQVERSIE